LKPLAHTLRHAALFAAAAYAFAVLLHLALRLVYHESQWLLGFFNNFTGWYFLPVALLLPLVLLLRARRVALLLLLVGVIGLLWHAPYYMPKARAIVPDDAPRLRVVTFNMWGGNGYFADSPGFSAIGEWLRTTDADVILLQETPLSQRTRADGVHGLLDAYPYQFHAETDGWTNAALSRLPIVIDESYLPQNGIPRYQRVVVEVSGQQVAIYHLHVRFPIFPSRISIPDWLPFSLSAPFGYDEVARNQEIRAMLQMLADEPLPYVLAGDFNMSDQSVFYDEVAASGMTDSWRAAGGRRGLSFPASGARPDMPARFPPVIRIDYVWHSSGLITLEAVQGPYLGSDHLPLVTTLALRET
jgi:endonuclease/exonuclease/phosphatase (EEP) superfamily protein YafD